MPGPVVVTKLRMPNTPSMPLERLDGRLDAVWQHRLAVVVAPAGSGKTTLLTRLASRAQGPVGWYRAEPWDSDESSLVRHLEAALAPALDGVARGWTTVAEAANAIEAWPGPQILLIVDDLHTLRGTAAEVALERLVDYAPESICFVVASRTPPAFNLSRLRVSGTLLELTSDDLRFRSWEVERLFRDFYAEPLPPEELARLARQTEGWAAGLQLFHLATRGKTADERRRMLAELGSTARLTREYLARNVLDQLPGELKRFLLETAVLGRLSGPLCDTLLGKSGSSEDLAELERRRLFTQSLAEDGVYRYHEILRTYLLAALLDELGDEAMRARFGAAGELLASAGHIPEALEAYCRGEDWDGARTLLASRGELVADGQTLWLESLPGSLMMSDPWLLLAGARRLRASGRLRDAVDRYRRAESSFGGADAGARAREERLAISDWTSPVEPGRLQTDAFGLVRASLLRDPLAVARAAQSLPGASGPLVAGLAALVAGHVSGARRELLHAAERSDAGGLTVVIASLGAGVAGALMGQRHALSEIEGAIAAAESAGLDWVARVGRAAMALSQAPNSVRDADDIARACMNDGDDWGSAVSGLFGAWASMQAGEDVADRSELIAHLRQLGAPVFEAWMLAMVALGSVRAGDLDASRDATSAEAVARSVGVDGALMLAHLALAEATADPIEAEDHHAFALALAHETGLAVADVSGEERESIPISLLAGGAAPTPMTIRLLGGFELEIDGAPVDLSGVRPRARALLRLLALDAGHPVHHETIEAALWPDADAASSARNLHVAIAALRRRIEPASTRGAFQLLRREGDAYVMSVPDGGRIDLLEFDAALARGHRARAASDADTARAAYSDALALYRGDLLPEDGPSEWVAERREASRLAAVDASQALAEILLERGQADQAARVCSGGLRIERYHDPLWRLLIRARDQAGDQGAARAARLGYDRMLAELGVSMTASNSPQ